jgi:hypothetical protein
MKIKFGSIVTDGRNKIGGHVMSKNRGGSYMRTKVTPVNPNTASQQAVRARFGTLSSGWRSLTQAQRDSWNGIVSQYQRTDIFGDLKSPSGLALYQRLNNNLESVGIAAIASPLAPSAVLTVVAGILTVAKGVPALSLALSAAVPAGTSVKVMATAPMSAGKSFVKSEFRQIADFPAATASPLNLLAAYVAKFGAIGAIGTKVFVAVRFVNESTGLDSPMQIVSATVVA